MESNPSPCWEDAGWPIEVTFDGGARRIEDREVAGAGATLWRHQLGEGAPRLLATTYVAIPWPAGAQVAEAIGCRFALDLLAGLSRRGNSGPGVRRARVVGDNLGVIRYGAGNARLRRVQMQAHLEDAIGSALAEGWVLDWQAVRRRLNRAADRLATRGVEWAARLSRQGRGSLAVTTTWFDEE